MIAFLIGAIVGVSGAVGLLLVYAGYRAWRDRFEAEGCALAIVGLLWLLCLAVAVSEAPLR